MGAPGPRPAGRCSSAGSSRSSSTSPSAACGLRTRAVSNGLTQQEIRTLEGKGRRRRIGAPALGVRSQGLRLEESAPTPPSRLQLLLPPRCILSVHLLCGFLNPLPLAGAALTPRTRDRPGSPWAGFGRERGATCEGGGGARGWGGLRADIPSAALRHATAFPARGPPRTHSPTESHGGLFPG